MLLSTEQVELNQLSNHILHKISRVLSTEQVKLNEPSQVIKNSLQVALKLKVLDAALQPPHTTNQLRKLVMKLLTENSEYFIAAN